MANLFNHNLIRTHIQNHQIDSFDNRLKVIQGWKKSIQTNKGVNEKSLQEAFITGVFERVLGYTLIGQSDTWTMSREVSTEVDATTPDGILGFYTADESITQAVIELKSPRISLDKKQNRAGKDYGTPVDQAFGYASKYDRCSWVIVSNMNEIRLYKVGRSQDYFESFFIDDLDNIDEFKKFHLLLGKENLIHKEGQSPTFSLSEKTKEHIQNISVSFYNLYKNIRIQLFEELKSSNPGIENAILVEKAQKFLDRIIFICFCEDLGLLPNDLLHHAIQRGNESFSDSKYVIWQEIRGVFRAIDAGSTKHNIPAYNGGLFALDEMLDDFSIRNTFFDAMYEISAYDFGTDLDVNILGHIFEQSISDIEELKADVQNEEYDPQKSHRKKDGIYYTPSYITKYIVENSLGKYLEDVRIALGENDLPDIESATTVQLEGRYKKKLLQFYRDYEARLKQVKVLDPACGSGAFLNQAFDFLLEEYRWIHSKLAELEEGQTSIFDSDAYQRSVLQDNLYGVDLNEESVEITKLSLWLKTADSRNALPYLDNNIKCGNSLIDDPEVAGDKVFKWDEEFPEIMAGGGFDVVIGNPPYVTLALGKNQPKIDNIILDYYRKTYPFSSTYKLNTFALFIESSSRLLKPYGYLSFIIPGTLLTNYYFKDLRLYLVENFLIKQLTACGEKVFNDAEIGGNVILTISNHGPQIEGDKKVNIGFLDDEGSISKASTEIVQTSFLNAPHTKFIMDQSRLTTINKLQRDTTELSLLCDFYNGIKTGDNKKFISKNKKTEIHKEIIRGRDVFRYFINFNSEYVLFDKTQLWSNTNEEMFNVPEKLIIRQTADRLISAYDDNQYFTLDTTHLILPKDKSISLKYIQALLNSKLMTFYYWNVTPEKGRTFAEVKIVNLKLLPIKIPYDHQTKLVSRADDMGDLNIHLYEKYKINFEEILYKYASKTGKSINTILSYSSFSNLLYSGRGSKLQDLAVTINDTVLTVYTVKTGNNKLELLKFEVENKHKQQYIKYYLETLNAKQLTAVNNYSGNILEKLLQIEIPDYDKPEVVSKVVKEWNQLQAEIADLEKKIEETDKEIDRIVYELYDLTDDEIKLIEGNVN